MQFYIYFYIFYRYQGEIMAYNNNKGAASNKRGTNTKSFRNDRSSRSGGRNGGYRERHSSEDEQFRGEREESIGRDDDNGGLIIGRNPVIEALKSGRQIDVRSLSTSQRSVILCTQRSLASLAASKNCSIRNSRTPISIPRR